MLINPELKDYFEIFYGPGDHPFDKFKCPKFVSSKTACLVLGIKNSSLKKALEADKVKGVLISRKIRLIEVERMRDHFEKRTNKRKWIDLEDCKDDSFDFSLYLTKHILGFHFSFPDGYFVLKDFCELKGISKQGVMKNVINGKFERVRYCDEFIYREVKNGK
jgi:hypothetical protein